MRELRGIAGALAIMLALAGHVATRTDAGPGDPLAEILYSNGGRILAVDANGDDRRQLSGPATPRPGFPIAHTDPAWSPDGSTVAFVRSREQPDDAQESQIMLMDSTGANPRALTTADRRRIDLAPAWSPSGDEIAFARVRFTRRGIVSRLIVIPSTGGAGGVIAERESRRLSYVNEPAWSPDGSQIAYTRVRLNRKFHFDPVLRIVGPDGIEDVLLKRHAASASWAPDGSAIAFESVRDRNGTTCGSDECSYNGEIYVSDADGTHAERLTQNKADDTAPDWSADGEHIVFASDRNNPGFAGSELYSILPDGGCLTWLTNGTPASLAPDWQPDPGLETGTAGCGATGRPALVEITPQSPVGGIPALWLGKKFRGLLLSSAETSRRYAFLAYADCSHFDPDACPQPLFLEQRSVCANTSWLLRDLGYARRLLVRRGVLLASAGRLEVFTGGADVGVDANNRTNDRSPLQDNLAAFRELRELDDAGPSKTPRGTALPRATLQRARELTNAYQRLGSIDAVLEELGIPRYKRDLVRGALKLSRALERPGLKLRRLDCER